MSLFVDKDAADLIQLAAQRADMSRVPVSRFSGARIEGDVAQIPVEGMLTNRLTWFQSMFGGAMTYGQLVEAVLAADQDPRVSRIELFIDSPGGTSTGYFEAIAELRKVSKPSKAIVSHATSAAYGIATCCDEIVATSRGSVVGSVGAASDLFVSENIVSVASTEAPEKRPNLQTDEGRAVIRKGLDALHAEFVSVLAENRKTTVDKVNADFGRGGLVYAADALKAGMIDGIVQEEPPQATTKMSSDLKSATDLEHRFPVVYREVLERGVKLERERVVAHLTLADASGAHKLARDAIVGGTELSAELQAEHMKAVGRLRELSGRTAGNPPEFGAPKPKESTADDFDARMAAHLDERLGTQ